MAWSRVNPRVGFKVAVTVSPEPCLKEYLGIDISLTRASNYCIVRYMPNNKHCSSIAFFMHCRTRHGALF